MISCLLIWKKYIWDKQCILKRRWFRMNELECTLSSNGSRKCREIKGKRKRNTGMMMTMMMTRMMMTHITPPITIMTTNKLTPSSGPPEGSSGKPTRIVSHKKRVRLKLSGCTYVNMLISVHTLVFVAKYSGNVFYIHCVWLFTHDFCFSRSYQSVFAKIHVLLVVAWQVSQFNQFPFTVFTNNMYFSP